VEEIFDKEVKEKEIYMVRSGQPSGRFGGFSGQKETSSTGYLMGQLVPKTERNRGIKEVAETLRKKISKIPGLQSLNVFSGDPMQQRMFGSGKPVSVEILGLDFDELDRVSEKVKEVFLNTKELRDVSVSREKSKPEYSIGIDRIKAAALGVPVRTIADTINTAFSGKTATIYREAGKEYDVFVKLREFDRKNTRDVESLEVRSISGARIPIRNFIKVNKEMGPLDIERKDQTRIVTVEANTSGEISLGQITQDLKKKLAKIPLSRDVSIDFGGSIKEQRDAFADLLVAFLLGMMLTYMVMASQFESFRDPFIIMFSVPFGIVGVIWALLLTGQTLNVSSFIGLIMLIGIVVNNAIVFIDYTIKQRAKGVSVREALLEAGRVRMRPILMTSLTTIFGMLPLALSRGEGSEGWTPLAVTVIGGLTVSMLITLVIIPVIYSLMEDRSGKKRKANSDQAIK
ncbi:MAG TPA: efflux RND transporter permease subunit, partial [bacterium]|nr:efflux RND transporter permease subunit [bacterium]